MVKNPPAMEEPQETWVQSLGREDPLGKGMATHSSILAWKISWTEAWQTIVHRVAESGMTEVTQQARTCILRASLVVQMVKNLPAVQETQFQSLG